MKKDLSLEIAEIVQNLFANGKTALAHFGIDAERIERIEQANPHVAKQYPWPSEQRRVA